MFKKIYQIGLITGLSFFISTSFAQQAPSANPMDDIPDAMPFDIPYGMAISLEKADQMVNAVMAEAKKRNWKMNIAVVDPSGAPNTVGSVPQIHSNVGKSSTWHNSNLSLFTADLVFLNIIYLNEL